MNIIQKKISLKNWTKQTTKKIGFVLHWIVGDLDSADRTFNDANRKASAHFGIGDNGEIHQYVDTQYVAWHAGVWEANTKYIGIEHAGGQLINGVRKKPTQECHQASIELITKLCKDLGIIKLERGKNIFKHSEIKSTQCCGSLDIDFITNEVNKKLNPEKPKAWENKRGREQQEKFAYINDLDAMYNRWVESGKCDKEVADHIADLNDEIKNFKARLGI